LSYLRGENQKGREGESQGGIPEKRANKRISVGIGRENNVEEDRG